ncbi:MAG: dethiobiotin synthetase [Methylophilaceae bacterium]|jgi:dethiobiotin synthetase
MQKALFITGTDTDVGKTHVACQIIKQYVAQGLKVVGMKPVAAGCELVDGAWLNEDVQKLTAASNVDAPAELVNSYCFKEYIAPHLAAEKAGVVIELGMILAAYQQLATMADVVVVEGAGGFLVPLNNRVGLADLAQVLAIPVVLVVGIRLGCISHSLLTVESIKARGLALHGWVANHVDPEMDLRAENVRTITEQLDLAPLFESKWLGSI